MVCLAMSDRETLFRQFGPKLLEAMFLVLIDQINLLRSKQNLKSITMQEIIDLIDNRVESISDYDWMKEEF